MWVAAARTKWVILNTEESNCISQVRVYGVESNGSTAPKAMYSHEGPVLDVTWSKVREIAGQKAS